MTPLTNRLDRYGNTICPVCELPIPDPYTCPFVREQRVHRECWATPFPRSVGGIPRKPLPARLPDRTWGGTGVGAPCAVCDLLITSDELEIEIEFAHGGSAPGLERHHVHPRCFAAWELKRTKAP